MGMSGYGYGYGRRKAAIAISLVTWNSIGNDLDQRLTAPLLYHIISISYCAYLVRAQQLSSHRAV